MKKISLVLLLLCVLSIPQFSFAATKTPAKVPVKKVVPKVVSKKTPAKKVVVKKKWDGTSKLLSAPLIDPNNPPGGKW